MFYGSICARVVVLGVVFATLVGCKEPAPEPTGVSRSAVTFLSGFVSETVATNLSEPTGFAFTPDGTRVYVAEKAGRVRVIHNGVLQATPFIQIQDDVHFVSDYGLVGIAVHPDFPTQPYVYIVYNYDPPGQTKDTDIPRTARVERIRVNAGNPSLADTGTGARMVVVGGSSFTASQSAGTEACIQSGSYVQDCIPTEFQSHGVGQLLFGTDGKLYVGTGDGTTSSPGYKIRSQRLDSLASKILRVDPLTGAGLADNPFYDGNPASNRSKIYSYGLRNPFRFSQHPTTGALYIGDVGWDSWEEINTGSAKNFGWPCYEGGWASGTGTSPSTSTGNRQLSTYFNNSTTSALCNDLQTNNSAQPPLLAWGHATGVGGSAMAGPVYAGTSYPSSFQGKLFFYDFAVGWVKTATLAANGSVTAIADFASGFVTSNYSGIVDMKLGRDGIIYFLYAGGFAGGSSVPGELRRFKYTGAGNRPPTVSATATPRSGPLPLQVTFNGSGSYDPDGDALSFAWTFGDGGTSSQVSPVYTYTTQGSYTARLTVSDPSGSSASQDFAITAGVNVPVVTITAPAASDTWQIGSVIAFSGTASDVEDGDLTAAMTWRLDLHHNQHVHPGVATATGGSGSYTVLQHDDNTAINVCAAATDSAGNPKEVCRLLAPRTAKVTVTSVPAGLTVSYGSQTFVTPKTFDSVVGSIHQVTADDQGGYAFQTWSDGGAKSHSVTVGTADTTLTATYGCGAAALPEAPTGLTGTPGNGQASLSWTAVTGAQSYDVKRSTVSGGPYTTVASALTATMHVDPGLTNGTTYHYVVSASNCLGAGANSAQVTVALAGSTTLAYEAEAGTRAGGANVQSASNASGGQCVGNMNATNAAVTWTGVSGGAGGTCQLKLRFSNGNGATQMSLYVGGSFVQKIAGAGTGGWNTFVDSASMNVTLAAGTGNTIKIQRDSGDGPLDLDKIDVTCGSGGGCSATVVPAAPTGLAATAGNAQVSLSWAAVSGAASYTVKRSTTSGSGYTNVATGVTTTSYTNTGLTNGTTYYYVVSATNCFGTGADSAQAVATPTSCTATSAPAAPTGLTASAGNAQATLSWTAVSGAASYTVGRSTTSGSGYTNVATGVTTTSYTNTGLTNGTTYYYVVSATNCFGAGSNSTQASVTPVPSSLPTPIMQVLLNENAGTSVANTGSAGGTLTRTTPTPAWSTNVPTTVGGTSCVDFGTTTGNHGVDTPGTVSALGGLTKFTITGWLNNRNATEGGGGNRVVTWINNGGNGVDLVYKADGSMHMGINQWPDVVSTTPRSSAGKITTSSAAPATNWRFFAVTYDSTNGAVNYYFGSNAADATLDVTRTYSRGAVGTSIGRFTIGHFNTATRSGATNRMFRGLVDNVRVYGAVLTAAQVVQVQRQ